MTGAGNTSRVPYSVASRRERQKTKEQPSEVYSLGYANEILLIRLTLNEALALSG